MTFPLSVYGIEMRNHNGEFFLLDGHVYGSKQYAQIARRHFLDKEGPWIEDSDIRLVPLVINKGDGYPEIKTESDTA